MTTSVGMTPRARWLAAMRLEPVDRLPFWPKLDNAYPRAQEPPFSDMAIAAIHDWIGSDKHMGVGGCVRVVRRSSSQERVMKGDLRRTLYRTRVGTVRLIERFEEDCQAWHPLEFPVKSAEDIPVMAEFFRDARAEIDPDGLEKSKARAAEIGDDAVTTTGIGTSALMRWVEWIAGVQNAHFMLADHPDEVAELFEAFHAVLRRKAEITATESPADLIYLTENTSTTLISPDQYRRYNAPHVRDCAEIVSGAGRLLVLHMCGHLKAVLPELATIPAAAFEAFTSPTLGNTTLADGRAACPDKCLVGGTNAMLWTKPAAEIIAGIEEALAPLAHHRGIVVTSAGVMPPLCKPETIREVCEWVKTYPAKM